MLNKVLLRIKLKEIQAIRKGDKQKLMKFKFKQDNSSKKYKNSNIKI